ncbi:MAG: helix-turn-helix transcriptional regulator [Alphaproteobacteria bacterium]|nr:helix-turn-helix transcriptional regulator [Alphaproteobacteria bacterium]
MNRDLRHLKRDVGCRIAEARLRCGLTQGSLSEHVGCSVVTISNLERGRLLPNLRMLAAVSRALSVPLRDLLGEVEKVDPLNRRRTRLELRCRALLNQLSNELLDTAVQQLSALARLNRRPLQQAEE